MDNVMTFLALLALFIFTASILGMHLFGGKYSFKDENGDFQTSRANFDDLFWALVTVFQVSCVARNLQESVQNKRSVVIFWGHILGP